jgi:hypothetical protein
MRYLILFFLTLLVFQAQGQITITSTDLLDVGDSIQLANVDTIPVGFNPGPSGPDMHWDFSNLTHDTAMILSFVDPATTPYGASFPASNIAVEGMVASFGLEGWAYGTKNLSVFQIDGAGGSYDIFEDIVVPFDPPEVVFDFPVNYLDSLHQSTIIDIRLDSPEPAVDSIRVKLVSSLDSRVDAWGEVMTPVWTGEVLRFRDVRTTIDSSWVKLLFFWIFLETNTNTSITYKYMANDLGYPVLQFNANADETEFSGVTYMLVPGVGTEELSAPDEISFQVYPNPANDLVCFRLQAAGVEGEVAIYNLQGKLLYARPVTGTQQELKIDVSAYPAGIYQMVLQTDGGRITAKKFVVR